MISSGGDLISLASGWSLSFVVEIMIVTIHLCSKHSSISLIFTRIFISSTGTNTVSYFHASDGRSRPRPRVWVAILIEFVCILNETHVIARLYIGWKVFAAVRVCL